MVQQRNVDGMGEPFGLTLQTGDGNGFLRAMPGDGRHGVPLGTALVVCRIKELEPALEQLAGGEWRFGAAGSALRRSVPFFDPAAGAEVTATVALKHVCRCVRAVCEAVAYAARHCFESADLAGGVTCRWRRRRQRRALQLFADILTTASWLSDSEEPAALGAVLAATCESP